MEFIIKRVMEHFEVYDKDGRFMFSADSYTEVYNETEHYSSQTPLSFISTLQKLSA